MTSELLKSPPAFLKETASFPEIAERFDVSLTKVYDWVGAGLPAFKMGRKRLIHIPTADAWVLEISRPTSRRKLTRRSCRDLRQSELPTHRVRPGATFGGIRVPEKR